MQRFRFATWNVNSIRTRLAAVREWLARERPDVVCFQETKVPEELFPKEPFQELGYHLVICGQKGYNGVATLARLPFDDCATAFEGDPDPAQRRFLSVRIGDVRIINIYIPNGSMVGSAKFAYKLGFVRALRKHLDRAHRPDELVLLAGDFNVAPEERDVHNPRMWEGEVLFHPEARAGLAELKAWGFEDLFRKFHQEGGAYTWWDYRVGAFRRNWGLRIDHVWASAPLAARARDCRIDTAPRGLPSPSDHVPVVAEFE
jgi:exodeoxyribonuclease-3